MSNLLDLYHIKKDTLTGREELRQLLSESYTNPFIVDWIIGTIARYEDDLQANEDYKEAADQWESDAEDLQDQVNRLENKISNLKAQL
jgi:hypothetical protein